MKRFVKFLLFSFLIFGVSSLFAETEPNENCSQSETVKALEGAVSHTVYDIKGTIVSTKWDEANNKPYYDMDYYHFSPGTSGEVKITATGSGNMYFWIGKSGCDVWDVSKEFNSVVTRSFKVAAGQRVDIKAMCRWPRTYDIKVEFIPDDQGAALPKISVKDAEISEGDEGVANMKFLVTLDRAFEKEILVDFATFDISAKAGEDYEESKGSLKFDPGETEKEITVSVFGDTKKEADEKFGLKLLNPVNASLGDFEAVGVILDDDDSQTPAKFDEEPNNDCENSEVIEALDGIAESGSFYGEGTIRPNRDGEGAEARDYYHFTVATDGTLEISLKSDLPMWFAVSTRGCFVPWVDETRWNVQRGVAKEVKKSVELKAGDRVDILALSYSNKNYEADIRFTPSQISQKRADLRVVKRDLKDPVNIGENVVYEIEIENIGEAAAEKVVLRDFISEEASFVSVSGEGFDCENDKNEVICKYASSLNPSEKAKVILTVKALKEGEITDVTEVSSDTSESDLSNNRAEEKTRIVKAAFEKTLIVPVKEAYDDAIEFEMIETSGYVYTGGGISIPKDYLADDMGILKNDLGKFRIRAAFRFEDVNISKDTKIKEAYIEFTAWKKDFDIGVTPTSFEIFAEDTGDSAPFAKGPTYDISNRFKVDAKVEWRDVEPWEDGEVYKTPDIKSLLEKVIQRDDWSLGNPVTFFVEPSKECTHNDECYRRAYDFDTDPSKAPKLIIKYEE